VQEGDGDAEIRKKVIKGLKILGVDEASALPYILQLLSVKDSGIEKIPMSPEARKDRIIEAINRIALKGSDIRPLIMAFEDLHWIDKSSEESLKYLLDSITGARVFLIFTYRPEFVHAWGGRSYHSQINLNRLSNRESLLMVSHLLGTEGIDSDLENLILEKTEGVPFFIEEFLRSLIDLKIIERKNNRYVLAKDIQDLTIPSTIQDVIMARVDSLPEASKEVLQTASVIEREFSYGLIKRVTGLSEEELLSHLSTLKDSELLYERGIYPQSVYIFRHALTREVVYDSILANRKKQLHEKIGNAIENLNKDNLQEYYGSLIEHYLASENYEKGAEYSKLACKKAQRAASFKEAIEHAKKRVFCAEKLPTTVDVQRKIIDARSLLAAYYIALNYHVEAKKAVEPIADLAIDLNYEKRLPGIYTAIGLDSLWVKEDFPKASQYLNEAISVSEKIGEFVSFWTANFHLGVFTSHNCEFEKGHEYLNKCLNMSLAANNSFGIVFTKSAISVYNHAFQGKLDVASQTSEESLRLAEDSGDILLKGIAYSAHGSICYFKGLFQEAESILLKGVAFCEKASQIALGAWASTWLGDLYAARREYERAQHYYTRGVSVWEISRGFPSWNNCLSLVSATAKVLNGDQHINLSDLLACCKNIKLKILEGWKARCMGEILLNIDSNYIIEAEHWTEKAIEANTRNGARWLLARDYVLYAELFKQKGYKSAAKEKLAKAIDILKECGADGWVKKYKEELASLS
jgi:tetratricopeptide (TPR) repeat protein